MNDDARILVQQLESRCSFDEYQKCVPIQLRDRFANPAVLITISVFIITALLHQIAQRQGRASGSLQTLCDSLRYLMPTKILSIIDRRAGWSLFPVATMLEPSSIGADAQNSSTFQKVLTQFSQVGRKGLDGLSSAASALAGKGLADQPAGLGNRDNSCFQNSILQGLSALKPLPGFLAAVSSGKNQLGAVTALWNLISDLNCPSNNGQTLWTPDILRRMNTWQQQDAQEYLLKILDQIDKEVIRSAQGQEVPSPQLENEWGPDDSTASEHSDDSGYQSMSSYGRPRSGRRLRRTPLEGLTGQRVVCTQCGHCPGLSLIPFNFLTLSLGNRFEHDLYEMLDNHTKIEPIQGVECNKCTLLSMADELRLLVQKTNGQVPAFVQRLRDIEEALEDDDFEDDTLKKKCHVPKNKFVCSTKTKQMAIARAPQSLVFHMNRSVFDEMTGNMFKNHAAVRFPSELDLGPWCLGSSTPTQKGLPDVQDRSSVGPEDEEEQWPTAPYTSMIAGGEAKSRITGPLYELRAVVTHQGAHSNGHYVCYKKYAKLSPKEKSIADMSSTTSDEEEDYGSEPSENLNDGAEQWWRLSDDNVIKVDEEIVLSQGGVFMLFYDCVDPHQVRVETVDASTTASLEEIGDNKSEGEAVPPVDQDDSVSMASIVPSPDGSDAERP
ncbi:putative ubiquitin carboxyl-terminal hydrolase [Cladorrhinum samala]|uniref:ubiquitinyl hydrolase 1 n=1 Tax=Cladorrhinum samala TaxID=585594 RepID=A0AAV9HLG5_9PEZI|nr:putative ubiquitin carboxyl-terminal hydrolase [Cladorrhinum samala]